MTPRDFVFWLQGHMEINNPETITEAQVDMIRDHLNLTLSEMSKKKDNLNQSQVGQGSSTTVNPFSSVYSQPISRTLIC